MTSWIALELLAAKKTNESLNDIVGKLTVSYKTLPWLTCVQKDPKNLREMYLLFLQSHSPSTDQKLKLVENFIKEGDYEDENGALPHQMKIAEIINIFYFNN